MKFLVRFLTLCFLLLVSGAFAVLWAIREVETPRVVSDVELVLAKGTGLNKTAQMLEEKGIVKDARLFIAYARLKKLVPHIKAGEYRFGGVMSLKDAAEKLVKGDVIVRSITIPEGKALVEIKQIVKENPYLSGEITVALKEGDVLPETYHFTRGESRNSLLLKAKTAMDKVVAETYAKRDADLPLKSAKELLILASIVEKETGLGAERAKVASVFVNRLNLGMKLQTDPTVIYAVTGGRMDLGRPIYKKDLAYDSPYNTYVYAGLPPTPICSPGRAAIEAAAHPEQTKYLYFVADGITGGHRFANSLKEHNKNVAAYRRLNK